jgi:hypothetical protein
LTSWTAGRVKTTFLATVRASPSTLTRFLAKLLKDNADKYSACSDWNASYVTDYETDLAWTDSLGTSMQTRLDMYKSHVLSLARTTTAIRLPPPAKYWRIRTGIDQSRHCSHRGDQPGACSPGRREREGCGLRHGMGHEARGGRAHRRQHTTNFISWVNTHAWENKHYQLKTPDFFAKAHFREKSRCAPKKPCAAWFWRLFISFEAGAPPPVELPPAEIWTVRIFQFLTI